MEPILKLSEKVIFFVLLIVRFVPFLCSVVVIVHNVGFGVVEIHDVLYIIIQINVIAFVHVPDFRIVIVHPVFAGVILVVTIVAIFAVVISVTVVVVTRFILPAGAVGGPAVPGVLEIIVVIVVFISCRAYEILKPCNIITVKASFGINIVKLSVIVRVTVRKGHGKTR